MESEKDKEARMRRLEAKVRAAEKEHACDPTEIFDSSDEEREFWQWFNANTYRLEGMSELVKELEKMDAPTVAGIKQAVKTTYKNICGRELAREYKENTGRNLEEGR